MPPTTASGGKGRGVAHPVRKGTGKGKGGVAGKSTSGKNIFGGKRHRYVTFILLIQRTSRCMLVTDNDNSKIPKDMIRGISMNNLAPLPDGALG